MTAADLAATLEVSVATARRDLEALSAAGIPVYPQSGRGGGWSLVGGARTDLSGLSATEAQALFLPVEQRRSRTWATVLVEARYVPVLRNHFGRHCHPEGERDDGRTRVRLGAPTPLDIARHLAGWGAMIEVVEPRSVQDELARIGAELAGRYPGEH